MKSDQLAVTNPLLTNSESGHLKSQISRSGQEANMMVRQVLSHTDDRWLRFVRSNEDASVFHTPAWLSLISECYGFRSFILAIVDDKNVVVAGIPLMDVSSWLNRSRWVSVPFSDHCAPLSADERSYSELMDFLVDHVNNYSIRSVELRYPIQTSAELFVDATHVLHTRAIDGDLNEVYRSFSPKRTRSAIRKAENAGVEVRLSVEKRDMDTFYELHLRTRKRLGAPIQPRRFFDLLHDRLSTNEMGFVMTAWLDQHAVAAGLFLTCGSTLTYKYGASDANYWSVSPNNLLIWKAIQWGSENRYASFDMGKTDRSNKGLRRFKGGWGTIENPLEYSVLSQNAPKQESHPLVGLVTPIIRNTPPWVGRMIGEFFYKYAA